MEEVTQHHTHFEGSPITVQLGWDKGLRCYYMAIIDGWEAHGKPLYTSFICPDLDPQNSNLQGFRSILDRLGIEISETLFQCRRLSNTSYSG
ncbi:MAG: hypothetical protein KZQ99_17950 [Candidatus Thiodiazotropha sp. (ex Dulcina madagascariensis)]|nr:hypothetical protein [Candidatus Thiodiazotropha sp. (ex Dulcina madagascariensis)]